MTSPLFFSLFVTDPLQLAGSGCPHCFAICRKHEQFTHNFREFASRQQTTQIQIILKRLTKTTSTITMSPMTPTVLSSCTSERSMAVMPPAHVTPFSFHVTFSGPANSNHDVLGKKDRCLAIMQAALDILDDLIEEDDEPAAHHSGSPQD
jgi:hypothetical protein